MMIDASVYKDAAAPAAPDESKRAVADLAAEMVALAAEIDAKEAEVKELRAKHDDIEQQQLPSAMRAIGMKEFTLTSGEVVSLKKIYRLSMREGREADCASWLEQNGHGGLVKNVIAARFGMGQSNAAAEYFERVKEIISEVGGELTRRYDAAWNTLAAFYREVKESGQTEPPEEMFSTMVEDRASIKMPKKTKSTSTSVNKEREYL